MGAIPVAVHPSNTSANVHLVYLNNRYHDPTLGQFVSVDPLVTTTGEPYIYGAANPITYSDPSGLMPPIILAPGWVIVDDAPKPMDPDFGEPEAPRDR